MRKEDEVIEKIITKYYEESANYTKILSVICRQLAFAEGFLFWFALKELNSPLSLITFGFVALLLYFIFDILQYLIGHIKYYNAVKKFENDFKKDKINKEEHYELPANFNTCIDTMLYIKLFCIFGASLILIVAFILGFYC